MTISLQIPEKTTLKPSITVFGVGGGGGNAVANMIRAHLEGVNFVVANTDAQALAQSPCSNRIQLGEHVTKGLGAGSYPEVGSAAAEESYQEIVDYLNGSNMVFVTAGMGGGTGTGAAPVVARLAKEEGILTVGVVTKPFHFEGAHRMKMAEQGLTELQKYVDTLIVIPNQNLFRIADKSTTFLDAFKMADEVLHSGVRGITDLMVMPGLINLDFSDVRAIMSEMGKAMMGTGEGEGDQRAIMAAEAAIANPLLDNVSMRGARGVLINITGGPDLTLFEVDEAANRIREEVDGDANIIFGSIFDQSMSGKLRVSVVATGIDAQAAEEKKRNAVVALESASAKAPVIEPAFTSKRPDFSDRHAEEYDGAFIPPEPLSIYAESGNILPEASEASESRTRDIMSPPTSYSNAGYSLKDKSEDARSESSKNSGGQGFFGGLFGKKPANPLPEEDKSKVSMRSQLDTGADSNLDIPAILRRKP